ncbi:MAG: hypothetical protein R6U17_06285 [Thermoplasmata archaeon]
MTKEEGDRAPLVLVVLVASALPLLFKLLLLYLGLKRTQNKRRRVFRKALKKNGMDDKMVDRLCDEIKDISLRDILSKTGIPDFKDIGPF